MIPTDVYYTLKDKDIKPAALAKWVKARMPSFQYPDCLIVAHIMIKGERWNPPIEEVHDYEEAGPCLLDARIDISSMNLYERHDYEQGLLYALLQRGAKGDAQAAIDYCKAEIEGKVSHGIYA